jgi:hypothetical protein
VQLTERKWINDARRKVDKHGGFEPERAYLAFPEATAARNAVRLKCWTEGEKQRMFLIDDYGERPICTDCRKPFAATAKQIAAMRRQWPEIVLNLPALLSEEARSVHGAETCGLTLHHRPSYSLIKERGQIVPRVGTICPNPLPR